jgi:hypothetical protein
VEEMKKDDKEEKNGISLPLPSSSALRGRQSVRATFKLSEKAIGAISIVATHLGSKQKSLFDHLIDDARSSLRRHQEILTHRGMRWLNIQFSGFCPSLKTRGQNIRNVRKY